MIRAGAVLAFVALFGAAPFVYETMPPGPSAGMFISWSCCVQAKNPQRGP
jgi:hypothetical protein